MRHIRRLGVGLCAILVASYVAAPFCMAAGPQARGCCDPADPCAAGTGLTAPDCCRLDAGRSAAAMPPATAPALRAAQDGGASPATMTSPGPALAGPAHAVSILPAAAESPPLFLLHASLLR